MHVQKRGVRGQADETGGKRDGARERVPGSAAVAPDDAQQECHADQPPAHRDQHACVQQRRGGDKSCKRQHLAADQSGAHGRIAPRRQRRLVHPPREYRQHEAEEERRQHQILHHDRVEPPCVKRRRRQAQRVHVSVDEPQCPPGHCQQYVGRARKEQESVRRGRQQRRRGRRAVCDPDRACGHRHEMTVRHAGRATGVAARIGRTQCRATNHASSSAPTLKIVSPGTRIHTGAWTIGWPMNSAERAYQ